MCFSKSTILPDILPANTKLANGKTIDASDPFCHPYIPKGIYRGWAIKTGRRRDVYAELAKQRSPRVFINTLRIRESYGTMMSFRIEEVEHLAGIRFAGSRDHLPRPWTVCAPRACSTRPWPGL